MLLSEKEKQAYLEVLKTEMIPAMGCTEPIAIAYAAARAQDILGEKAVSANVSVSGNIIKNVKSVIVPNTNGMKGIEAACAVGVVAGDSKKNMLVISSVTEAQKAEVKSMVGSGFCTVSLAPTTISLDITVTLKSKKNTTSVRIVKSHLNVVHVEKNGKILLDTPAIDDEDDESAVSFMSVEGIYAYAETCDMKDVSNVIGQQIEANMAIAKEGLDNDWGANVGSVLLAADPESVRNKAKAYAAAGSDARMSGCEMPVVINSGSGNQGLTVSLPVVVYGEYLGVSQEKMYRALVLSNLLGVYQKKHIGRLSAYCGAVSAGCASGAAISYLMGGGLHEIAHTLVNGLAISSGIVCDGAKPSCAGKIAIAVETGILACGMAKAKQQFHHGEGIISKGVENTITNIGRLGKNGMKETDIEILNIMLGIK